MANNIVEIILRGRDESAHAIASSVKNLQGLDSALSSVGSHLAGIVSVGAMVELAKSSMQFGDELSKASEKLGISVEKLSALNYAAGLSDVSFESLQKSMKFLSKAVTDGQVASSDAAIAFRAMGVSTKDASGNIKPLNDMFSLVADKFSRMEDGAGKVSLAVALFGRAGMDMIPMLNKGAGGIAEMEKEAGRLGATISGSTAKSLEEANDNLKSFWMTLKGTAATISGTLLGSVKSLGDAFGESLSHTDTSKIFFGPNAVKFPAPPLPLKIAAPNVDAIKKEMEAADEAARKAKKREEEVKKYHAKNLEDRLKAEQEVLAEEMGYTQGYADFVRKEEEKITDAIIKNDEYQERIEAEQLMAKVDAMRDALREESEITEKIAEYRAEDAFNAAMKYGNAAIAIRLLNEGLYEQFRIIDEGREKVSALQNLYSTVFRGRDGNIADMTNLVTRSFHKMTDVLTDFVMTGKLKFREFTDSVISDMARMAIQQSITKPLYQGIQSGLASIFSVPGKAAGGPVSSGNMYMVGERGPELFVPSASGSIVPNGGGGGGNSTVIIRNEGGEKMQVKSARTSFDVQGTITDIVIDSVNRNVHGLRDVLGGA